MLPGIPCARCSSRHANTFATGQEVCWRRLAIALTATSAVILLGFGLWTLANGLSAQGAVGLPARVAHAQRTALLDLAGRKPSAAVTRLSHRALAPCRARTYPDPGLHESCGPAERSLSHE